MVVTMPIFVEVHCCQQVTWASGAHLSRVEFSQDLGAFNVGYEGNAFNENKFTVGGGTDFFKAKFNTNGKNVFGLELSTGSLLPHTELGATLQQEEHHSSAGLTITISSSKHSD
jgi:hypothetical protein